MDFSFLFSFPAFRPSSPGFYWAQNPNAVCHCRSHPLSSRVHSLPCIRATQSRGLPSLSLDLMVDLPTHRWNPTLHDSSYFFPHDIRKTRTGAHFTLPMNSTLHYSTPVPLASLQLRLTSRGHYLTAQPSPSTAHSCRPPEPIGIRLL